MRIREVGEILGTSNIGPEADADRLILHVSTDSRTVNDAEVTLFVAVKTLTGDGANYISALYNRGCRAFVCSELPVDFARMSDAAFFVVDDPVKALQTLCAVHPGYNGETVAITGSRGKTTLKEWLFHLMQPLAETIRSPRSYNSQIGVPLSLWEITPETEVAIIEAGISRKGEMQALAECITPATVIFTCLGAEHSEGFSSEEEKAREKVRLGEVASVKRIIYNADSGLLSSVIEETCKGKELIGWSIIKKDAPLYISISRKDGSPELSYSWQPGGAEPKKGKILLSGDNVQEDEMGTNIENAANSLAYMLSRGISPQVIESRFKSLPSIGTRLNVAEGVNGCTVVTDSYASDLSSLRILLDLVARHPDSRRAVTLVVSDPAHEAGNTDMAGELLDIVEQSGVNRLITVGDNLKRSLSLKSETSRNANILSFSSVEELMENLSTSDFYNETVILKQSAEHNLKPIGQMLEARTHETVLEVNLDAIIKNYNYFRSHVPRHTGMIAMVKASGYGAGSYEIAKVMQDCGAAYVAVAVLDEGIELRRAGITMPIMVMNPKVMNYRHMFAWNLEPEVYSFEMLRDIIREAEKCGIEEYPVHIKIDTGMHRMGFGEKELPELMDLLCATGRVKVRSVFSHLATADCPDMDDYTLYQLDTFRRMSDYMLGRYPTKVLRHVLNSAGILRFPEHHYDMVRLGIGLYGVETLPPEIEEPLAVVSTLRTVIISIRDRHPGDTIGYGRKGKIERESRIAVIPIGYADGMRRSFGCGKVKVRVNGKEAPTVGNICMDACMIDVTDIDCREGDSVEIFGEEAPIGRLAEADSTIPYEILTSVSPRVKRVYYRQ